MNLNFNYTVLLFYDLVMHIVLYIFGELVTLVSEVMHIVLYIFWKISHFSP